MSTKDEIISKALLLFSKEGYENIGVLQIVEELGLTKPTLYHYFGNKEGLLRSILDRYYNPFLEQLKSQIIYKQDLILSVENLVLYYLNWVKKEPVFYQLSKNLRYSPMESDSYSIIKEYSNKEFILIKTFFESISKHHTGLKGKEEMLSFTFLGILTAYITYHTNQVSIDKMTDASGQKLAKQFLYGIFS